MPSRVPHPPFPAQIALSGVARGGRASGTGGARLAALATVQARLVGADFALFSIAQLQLFDLTRDPDAPPGSPLVWELVETVAGAGPIDLNDGGFLAVTVTFTCPAVPSQHSYATTVEIVPVDGSSPALFSMPVTATVVAGTLNITARSTPDIEAGQTLSYRFELSSSLDTTVAGVFTCDALPVGSSPFSSDTQPQFPTVMPNTAQTLDLAVSCAPGTPAGQYNALFGLRGIGTGDPNFLYSTWVPIRVVAERSVEVIPSLQPPAITLDQDSSTPCMLRVQIGGAPGQFNLWAQQVPVGLSLVGANQSVFVDGMAMLRVDIQIYPDTPAGPLPISLILAWRVDADEFHPAVEGQLVYQVNVRAARAAALCYRRFMTPNGDADQRISLMRFDGNDWRGLATLTNAGSIAGPGIASFNDRLWMAWRGVDGDEGLWLSSSVDGANWEPQRSIGGVGSFIGPQLIAFQDRLVLVWRGIDDDQRLFWSSTTDGSNWDPNPQAELGGATAYEANLAVFGNDLYAVWRGIDGDQTLWWSATGDARTWSPQKQIPGKFSHNGVGMAVYRNQLYMAGAGLGDNQTLWWARSDNGVDWGDSVTMGEGTSDVPALFVLNDKLIMVWRGVETDWHLYWSWRDAQNDWQPHQRLHDATLGQDVATGGRIACAISR